MFNAKISPEKLAEAQGQKFPPTPQQAAVIGAAPGPMLVVAGAGAGKTETMANRVVWLVANGFIEPERVLGLTFTRKAALELRQRIKQRLATFALTPTARDIDPTGALLRLLENINPTVSTYDSYAGRLVSEYGLLLPVEPTARLITDTELFTIARDVVLNYGGQLSVTTQPKSVTEDLLKLSADIDNHMADLDEIATESESFLRLYDDPINDKGKTAPYNDKDRSSIAAQQKRLDFLPMVKILRERLQELEVLTFGQQMTLAAQLASTHAEVGARERAKFGVVMLDEYQDTSHTQRVLLRSLFGGHDPNLTVTAVGDPMQSIYGWRGATAANLERFVNDFPQVNKSGEVLAPAPKLELTTSFRNPSDVLAGANAIADHAFRDRPVSQRPVQPLDALDSRGKGDVRIGWFATKQEEIAWIADTFAAIFHAPREKEFTGAVLVRKRKHIADIAEALQDRGVPVEIVGLAGLLSMPEIADLNAIASMLINPQDNAAALRILTGPAVNLGANDIIALHKRVRNLAGRASDSPDAAPTDPREKLQWIIDNAHSPDPSVTAGLTDAIADLGEPEKYSAEGYRRLSELAAALRYLRTHSVGRSISDLYADIEEVMGIRTEVLARQDPLVDGSHGTSHLDAFAQQVAAFERTPGATLRGLLEYFELAQDQEDGFEPGEVSVRSERVQLLTVHKSKGLEWQHVAVIHADNKTYLDESTKGASTETWMRTFTAIPSALRGDARSEDDLTGAPVFELGDFDTLKELRTAVDEHIGEFRSNYEAESARLFYVAVTRSEETLLVSASYNGKERQYANAPYSHLLTWKKTLPESVVQWAEELVPGSDETDAVTATFPYNALGERRGAVKAAAEAVRAAMTEPPVSRAQQSELTTQWEEDVNALLEEHANRGRAAIDVPVLRELTATQLVSLKENPEAFAKRSMRPVPFKPNSYAKRGTAFHEWLERHFGGSALLESDQLPGSEEEALGDATVEQLKEQFLASEWADKTPARVEQPFEITVGSHVVRGRMDAIFHDGADQRRGWMIVDWKTGQPPTGEQLRNVSLQLAVYRLAWAQLLSAELGETVDPTEIRAAFYYVAAGFPLEPGKLPDASELASLLQPGSVQVPER
ncbi:ATP-dependent DNA helicase UvrD1 [Corynebacterium kalinowskii]|uniref:DNA 3'-5' helicase n=1 Tax=Corynebacterium kalinowskii TaxID=2675216 RepID=A0A6B8W5Y0_9CORY|nr:UvrD-helicase domain-containing protein [Corynebacterium kalinowskii]QGU02658.1 ATP-dependent DNA helicase UvrD1 [Corynebacterium kalinowskii]